MKTETTAPKHTQGEWRFVSEIRSKSDGGFDDGVQIRLASVSKFQPNDTYIISEIFFGKPEEAEANAQRIVKAVNMHDEFLFEVKNLVYGTIEFNNLPLAVQKRFEQLLKQAEQK